MMLRLALAALCLAAATARAADPAALPNADTQRDLWCMAAFAAASRHAEVIGDGEGFAALTSLVAALGDKTARDLTSQGYAPDQQTALGRAFVETARADAEAGTARHSQPECLAAAGN